MRLSVNVNFFPRPPSLNDGTLPGVRHLHFSTNFRAFFTSMFNESIARDTGERKSGLGPVDCSSRLFSGPTRDQKQACAHRLSPTEGSPELTTATKSGITPYAKSLIVSRHSFAM